jgi:hypothetical protein
MYELVIRQRLLQRLNEKTSDYSVAKWDADHVVNEERKKSIKGQPFPKKTIITPRTERNLKLPEINLSKSQNFASN